MRNRTSLFVTLLVIGICAFRLGLVFSQSSSTQTQSNFVLIVSFYPAEFGAQAADALRNCCGSNVKVRAVPTSDEAMCAAGERCEVLSVADRQKTGSGWKYSIKVRPSAGPETSYAHKVAGATEEAFRDDVMDLLKAVVPCRLKGIYLIKLNSASSEVFCQRCNDPQPEFKLPATQ